MKRIAALCLLAFGLVSGCHAASPSFSSFNQTYFTTNNLFISIRTNWISTNSITTLIVTNLYVTNLYSTNIIVNGTNVATLGDLIWTNDTAATPSRIRVKTGISDFYTELTNTFTRGYSADDFIFPVLALGNNTLDSDLYSAFLLLSPTNDPAQVIIRLKSPLAANNLDLMCYTNAVFTGQCRLEAGSAVSGSGGTVRLNNNQDWDGINGAVIRLRYISPDWIEVGRWFAGSNSQPTTITINPTDNYVPVRTSANSFGDAPLHVTASGSTNMIVDGALYFGTNSFPLWGDTDLALVQFRSVENGDSDTGGIAIYTQMTNNQAIGTFDLTVNTNGSLLQVGWNNGPSPGNSISALASSSAVQFSMADLNAVARVHFEPTVTSASSASISHWIDTDTTWTQGTIFGVRNNATNMLSVGHLGQLTWGPGTTNVLSRSGASLVLTNGSTTNAFTLRNGLGTGFHMTYNTGGNPRLLSDNGSIYMGSTFIVEANILPSSDNSRDIGSSASNGAFKDSFQKGIHYLVGANDGSGNATWLKLNHTGNAGSAVYNSDATGTQTFRDHTFQIGGTNVMRIDRSASAGETRFWLYDEDNGTMERVTVGAADSGGAGYKLLRIPN